MFPQSPHIRIVEAISRKLLLLGKPHLPIRNLASGIGFDRPHNVIDRIHILQKPRNPFQSIRNLPADRIQIHPPALLKVRKLRNLQPIQHHLPPDAPRAANRPLPVVLFELNVVFFQIDPDRHQRLEIHLLNIYRWRLQDHLQLRMTKQPIRILPIPPIRRPPRRLRISDPHRFRPQHPQKSIWRHRPRPHLNVIRLLQHAPAVRPEPLQRKQKLLNRQRLFLANSRNRSAHISLLKFGSPSILTAQPTQARSRESANPVPTNYFGLFITFRVPCSGACHGPA